MTVPGALGVLAVAVGGSVIATLLVLQVVERLCAWAERRRNADPMRMPTSELRNRAARVEPRGPWWWSALTISPAQLTSLVAELRQATDGAPVTLIGSPRLALNLAGDLADNGNWIVESDPRQQKRGIVGSYLGCPLVVRADYVPVTELVAIAGDETAVFAEAQWKAP